jgi:hypothetical protein
MSDQSATQPDDWPNGILYGSIAMIVLSALTFVGIGAWFVVRPETMDAGGDLIFRPDGNAANEIRAIYGGLELGIGLFYAWCLFNRDRFKPALILIALTLGLAGLARFYGMTITQAWETNMVVFGLSEVFGAAFALLLLLGIRAQETRL